MVTSVKIPVWRIKAWSEKYGTRWYSPGGKTEFEARVDLVTRYPYITKVIEVKPPKELSTDGQVRS